MGQHWRFFRICVGGKVSNPSLGSGIKDISVCKTDKKVKSNSQTGISKRDLQLPLGMLHLDYPIEKTVSPRSARKGVPDGCFHLSFLILYFQKQRVWYYVCALQKIHFSTKMFVRKLHNLRILQNINAFTYRVALTSTTKPFACRLSCRYNCAVLHQRRLAHVLLYYFQCWHMVKMTQAFKIYGR